METLGSSVTDVLLAVAVDPKAVFSKATRSVEAGVPVGGSHTDGRDVDGNDGVDVPLVAELRVTALDDCAGNRPTRLGCARCTVGGLLLEAT
jgi:hypothetical protein